MRRFPRIFLLALFVVLLFLPPFLDRYIVYLLNIALLSVLAAVGLNIITGYSGQINLGQSGFVGIGAYATTILTIRVGIWFWAALPIGAIISAFAGLCIALPCLRLRGVYLALVTFGFAAVIETILVQWVSMSNGPDGLVVPVPHLGSFVFDTDLRMYYPILGIAIAMLYLAKNIVNSRIGRAFVSMRDSEIAAQAIGVHVTSYKIMAFILSAFYGGMAGGLYAGLVLFISPDAFGVLQSIVYMTMIVVGGMGSIFGSIIGGGILSLLPEFLRGFKGFQEFLFGTLLILSLIFFPDGLVGLFRKNFTLKEFRLHRQGDQ
jgi:branched-chain amino acid transport system permease protein